MIIKIEDVLCENIIVGHERVSIRILLKPNIILFRLLEAKTIFNQSP